MQSGGKRRGDLGSGGVGQRAKQLFPIEIAGVYTKGAANIGGKFVRTCGRGEYHHAIIPGFRTVFPHGTQSDGGVGIDEVMHVLVGIADGSGGLLLGAAVAGEDLAQIG